MSFSGKKGSERRGSKKGLSRRHLEGRNAAFREHDPLAWHAPYLKPDSVVSEHEVVRKAQSLR